MRSRLPLADDDPAEVVIAIRVGQAADEPREQVARREVVVPFQARETPDAPLPSDVALGQIVRRLSREGPPDHDLVHTAVLQALDELLERPRVRRGPWALTAAHAAAHLRAHPEILGEGVAVDGDALHAAIAAALRPAVEDDRCHRCCIASRGGTCECAVCRAHGGQPTTPEPWPWPVSPDDVRGWLADRLARWEAHLDAADPEIVEQLAFEFGVFDRKGNANTKDIIASVEDWARRQREA